MDRLARAIAILDDLIAYPTVSSESNLEIIVHLASLLSEVGAQIELFHDSTGRKANLFATLGPDAPGGIVLSGHTDVVPVEGPGWSGNPFRMRQENGRLYGRGTCDMKGFIAATLACLPDFAAADLRRPLHFAFTYDEEVGCLGAQQLVEELRARDIAPAMAIIGEPTEMRIIDGHKGCNEYTTRFTGTQGHGSAPEKGVNAAEYAARFVSRLLVLREELRERVPGDSTFDPPWSTLNVGQIHGGTARNVLAGAAEVEWETRPVVAADAEHARAAVREFCEDVLLPEMRRIAPDAAIETEIIGEIAGLIPMKDNAARDLVARLTGEYAADLVAFGTEAGLFQSLGMSVVICGPGSIAQAHQPDEFLEIAQLERCLDMLAGLANHS
ncbi:acetylornithine deacetylase [Aliiruegeria sabulilitoris]|uniref:acetylornithine deacetylase n=1 Tax=Aliiruegeria sabulilitoris TaxID=1510458 RepID=UPI000832E971|nr:acetylornithine deacetylase [Aliiruegeria sabulilitoris]NDR58117.1 acetylornithine deacetylase [Pseudoruegeria sp. M32A2M]